MVEKEGAVWFASSALGEDKDNVLVRSTGTPTYFASDIAYHYDKFIERDFDQVIDIWGADHQGHVSRMKAAVSALGVDPARLDVIIGQLVTPEARRRDGAPLEARGRDHHPARRDRRGGRGRLPLLLPVALRRRQMDFDLELAKQQSAENPVYYVQYAHARIAGILRLAAGARHRLRDGDVSLLTPPAELALVRKMLLLPELVESIAREPRAAPPAALRAGAGDGLPRLLREVPRGHGRRPADEGAAEAGGGGEDRAGAHAGADGDVARRTRCRRAGPRGYGQTPFVFLFR